MPTTPRTWIAPVGLLAAGAVAGAVLAGTFSANAETPTLSPAVGTQAPGGHGGPGMKGTALTGDTKAKAEKAALAKYPGTAKASFQLADGTYEVHVLKADGTRQDVLVSKDFAVTGLETHAGRGPGMGHGMRGTALTGDTKTKVEKAALAKYSGNAQASFQLPDGTYEVHVLKADGTRQDVLVGKDFAVTGLETHAGPPPVQG